MRDEAQPGSDVDLLISFNAAGAGTIGLFDFSEMMLMLQDALGCKVDLVEKEFKCD